MGKNDLFKRTLEAGTSFMDAEPSTAPGPELTAPAS